MNLSGNTILITGGTSGIGRGFAEAFMERGNNVIICGRRKNRLEQITEQYPEIVSRVCDISNDREREDLYQWVVKHYPDTNVLINNAGIQLKTDVSQAVNMKDVKAETETNFYGPVPLSSLFARHLATKKESAIINISSGLAFTPMAKMPIYCATKAAIHSFSLSLRHQLKDRSVKVFEIIPPSVDTELGHEHRSDPNESHGGMSISEFVTEALEAITSDTLEYAVGPAKNLYAKGEELFERLN